MAVSLTVQGNPAPPGDKYYYARTLTLDNSYPSPSGYVITPSTLGINVLRKIINIEPTTLPAAATWTYWIVPTFNTDGTIASFALHLAVVSTGVEVANAVNVSTASYNFVFEGS